MDSYVYGVLCCLVLPSPSLHFTLHAGQRVHDPSLDPAPTRHIVDRRWATLKTRRYAVIG